MRYSFPLTAQLWIKPGFLRNFSLWLSTDESIWLRYLKTQHHGPGKFYFEALIASNVLRAIMEIGGSICLRAAALECLFRHLDHLSERASQEWKPVLCWRQPALMWLPPQEVRPPLIVLSVCETVRGCACDASSACVIISCTSFALHRFCLASCRSTAVFFPTGTQVSPSPLSDARW